MGFFRKSLLLFSFIFILLACNSNSYDIDVSDVTLPLTFHHSDSILSKPNPSTLISHRNELNQIDKDIAGYLFGYCYGIRINPDTSFLNGMSRYNNNPFVVRLELRINQQFEKKIPQHRASLTAAFKRMKYHFKDAPLPQHIFWVNSGFTSSVFCSEKSIALGLERYLGEKTDVIKELPNDRFFSWIKEGMAPQYLERDAVIGWLSTHHIEETKENYATEMIRWGKLLFITSACLPQEKESIILRYTSKDYDWAMASEGALWKYIVDEQLLYNTGEDAKQSLLHEGPFTRGLPQESPDRMGQFLGYRMVKQYMETHDLSLNELKNTPYLKILQAYEAPEKK
jgi:hypothetical protein